MARTALRVKSARNWKKALKQRAAGKKVEHATRLYNRCRLCSRVRGYMRRFELCRICFRELASRGQLMGVSKCSW